MVLIITNWVLDRFFSRPHFLSIYLYLSLVAIPSGGGSFAQRDVREEGVSFFLVGKMTVQ